MNILSDVLSFNLILAAFAVFPSGIIQGYAGFGGALVAVPFLAVLFDPVTGFAMILFVVLFGQGTHFLTATKSADWNEVGPVAAASAFTMTIGILFLVASDPIFLRKCMGVIIFLITLLMASNWNYTGKRGLTSKLFTGGFSGAITGGFGVPGFPLQVMYFHSSTSTVEMKRANVLAALACGVMVAIMGLFVQNIYTQEMLIRGAIIAPTFIMGAKLGEMIFKVAPADWFQKVTYLILLITALMLFVF
ncbi:sulfite exporter TauE/SafE family protein [Gammaproteobacteria bacterium]|nr:sulfite exporter TauE/SafE family protein [Gammaproteobacteria bacterium]